MRDFYDILTSRHSTRSFKDKKVSKEDLEKIVNAAKYAPNSRSRHLWKFIATNDKKIVDEYCNNLKEALGVDEYTMYGAPAMVIVTDDRNYANYIQNGAVAMQNIMLTAEYLGLSSVWIHPYKKQNDCEKVRKIYEKYKIPKTYNIIAVAAIGYEDEKHIRAEKKAIIEWL